MIPPFPSNDLSFIKKCFPFTNITLKLSGNCYDIVLNNILYSTFYYSYRHSSWNYRLVQYTLNEFIIKLHNLLTWI